MYLEHFGLREFPFTLTPDTAFFFNRAGYQDGLNVLLVALRSGEGFVKVVGEVGTGKTVLARTLLNTLTTDYVTAYIHNPYLTPEGLLRAVADELRVRTRGPLDQHGVLQGISRRLINLHAKAKRVVLVLDEVQAMPVETLEALRLLTNLETEKHKLLQVVLFGQPELDRLLRRPSVRQLRQRITFSYRLLPMNRPGLEGYLMHRLAVAGRTGQFPFAAGAIALVYRASGGVPRLANILCHKAMMAAYGKGSQRVTSDFVRASINDTASAHRLGRWWPWVTRLAVFR